MKRSCNSIEIPELSYQYDTIIKIDLSFAYRQTDTKNINKLLTDKDNV